MGHYFEKVLKPSDVTKSPTFSWKQQRTEKRIFFFLLLPVTFVLLLLEHPQLRGRKRQPLVTRILVGSEPSSGCQVSTGQWLINRTFPFLNLRRMGSISGYGGLTSWVLAHEAVSWVHLPLQLSIHTFQARPVRRQALALSLVWIPFQPPTPTPLGPFAFSFPLPPKLWQVCVATTFIFWARGRQDGIILALPSADFLHFTLHYDLCVQHSECGLHGTQIIFSCAIMP